jgi:protein-arginine deiminase
VACSGRRQSVPSWRNGLRVRWDEDFFWAHFGGGEVRGATNALRDISHARPWWIN